MIVFSVGAGVEESDADFCALWQVVCQVRTESNTVLSVLGAETRDLGLGRGTQGVCPKFELPTSTINVACLTPQIAPVPHE